MNLSQELIAVILGIVEGLTEFLPVSSTGHLILAGHALGFVGEKAKLFEIFIQLGAIMSVVVLYPKFFINLLNFKDKGKGQKFSGMDGLLKLAFGCAPVFVMGFLLHGFIKQKLFNPLTVAIGLILGAIFILLAEKKQDNVAKTSIAQITLKDCLLVGAFQCIALWPGVSRAGATIIGGLIIGFERKLAAEFSFLLAVPVLTAAVLFDLYKNFKLLGVEDIQFFSIGLVVSFVTAIIAIRFFIRYLEKHSLQIFAYYRIILAAVVLLLLN